MNENTNMWERLLKYVPMVLILLSIFLLAESLTALKEYRYIGSGQQSNVVTVTGEGEAFIVPDVAEFSFSVIEEAKDVSTAQENATEKMNRAIDLLKEQGIEEKDIKTVGYNVYPKYEYQRSVCTEFSCPPGKQILMGYEVNHSVSVKVRKVDEAGEIIGILGGVNVSNISGVSFTVDNEDEVLREARQEAIEDAKSKAKELSRDLDVRLVRIVSFSENNFDGPVTFKTDVRAPLGMGGADMAESAPNLPTGENRIVSNVAITYEIR